MKSLDRAGLLEQFDNVIFNALVEKFDILLPTHFVFVLKSGMRFLHIKGWKYSGIGTIKEWYLLI